MADGTGTQEVIDLDSDDSSGEEYDTFETGICMHILLTLYARLTIVYEYYMYALRILQARFTREL